jgi:hypothetical protein
MSVWGHDKGRSGRTHDAIGANFACFWIQQLLLWLSYINWRKSSSSVSVFDVKSSGSSRNCADSNDVFGGFRRKATELWRAEFHTARTSSFLTGMWKFLVLIEAFRDSASRRAADSSVSITLRRDAKGGQVCGTVTDVFWRKNVHLSYNLLINVGLYVRVDFLSNRMFHEVRWIPGNLLIVSSWIIWDVEELIPTNEHRHLQVSLVLHFVSYQTGQLKDRFLQFI